MKSAIIIHGWPEKEEYFDPKTPSSSNEQWLPWIQKQLILKGINAQTPEMPDAYLPVYEKWKSVFEQFKIDEGAVLIGHSCGAGFLVRWLSENKVKVKQVILVAPFLDPENELNNGFFDFTIRDISDSTEKFSVFYSTDDDEVITKSVQILKDNSPGAHFREFTDKGHFCTEDMGSDAFPELLGEVVY